jgi:proteasome lid subunit RPN8/RPN11
MRDTRSVSNLMLLEGNARGRLCRWDAPDGACGVVMGANLMEELRRQAIQAYLSVPKRGAEIGGLLFGNVRQDGSIAFHIDSSEDIPCEYRFGPSYKLSEADFGLLRKRLAQHQRDRSEPVIGWYRSYTGREAALDQTDLELLREVFPHPHVVTLLLQPISAEKCMARFQFGSDGEPAADQPYEPFLFDPAQLKVEVQAEPEPPEAVPVPVPVHVPAVAEPAVQLWEPPPVEPAKPVPVLPAPFDAQRREWREDDEPRASRGSQIWLPVLLCALAAIAGASGYGYWTLEHQPRWSPMGLDATGSAQELVLSWDSAAPLVQQASHGVMTVTDGSAQSQIPLTAAQLRGGKLSYLPSHANVLIRFLVYDAGNRAFGDSLRVANLHPTTTAVAPTPVTPVTPEPPPTTQPEQTAAGGTSAVARREVQPDVPAGILARVRVRTVVPVQLYIDASGRVTGASAKGARHGLDRYLADLAVKAARRWSFVPAHSRNGSAIASAKTVEFVFFPDASGIEKR